VATIAVLSLALVVAATPTGPWAAASPHSQNSGSSAVAASEARGNALLASEAFRRAARATERWLNRRDARTGLFPHTLRGDRDQWTYGDVGSDLYPFLAIATRLLLPDRTPEIMAVLAAERATSSGLPRDVDLKTGQLIRREAEKEMLAAVEYAKDGLLPLVELLGPEPWLPRLREVTDAALAASSTPTRHGTIPADSTEVNGSTLQVLARLYWLTRDPAYLQMGRKIAAAYLDDALPDTGYLPIHRWDFVDDEPIGPRRFYLGDHGAEIVSGLVEWHRVEVLSAAPEAATHRRAIRKMLDRLLETGRTPEGLWYEAVEFPSGRVRDREVSDNWGYLGQAYLDHAAIERSESDGDPQAAARYELAAAGLLRSVTAFRAHRWEDGTMDGYADTLEGAIYLLRYLDVPEAESWADEQIAGLYRFQRADGRVTDENIDGNFIRTVLLYAFAKTHGARMDPWDPNVTIGAARDGDCLHVYVRTESPWAGRIVFDTPRHRAHFRLPADYPRLNQWPEYFAVEAGREYTWTDQAGQEQVYAGEVLGVGLQLSLDAQSAQSIQVCPRLRSPLPARAG
jgi:hypothetical protein